MHERGYARCCMNPCPATDAYPSPLCTGAWRTSVARGWQRPQRGRTDRHAGAEPLLDASTRKAERRPDWTARAPLLTYTHSTAETMLGSRRGAGSGVRREGLEACSRSLVPSPRRISARSASVIPASVSAIRWTASPLVTTPS